MKVGELKEILNKYDDDEIVRLTDPGSLIVTLRDGDTEYILSFGDTEGD